MDKKKRSFKVFLESSGIEGVKKIVLEYATENDTVTLSYLADKYNLSISAVKRTIEYAIVNCLVSYKISLFIKEKAHRNQARHCKAKILETSSDKYYGNVLKQRLSFVKTFDNEKVTGIVKYYLDNPNLSVYLIADSLGLSAKELNVVLEKAIIFNIIDDETFNNLKKLALDKSSSQTRQAVNLFFVECANRRTYYKLISYQIAMLHFQLESYDSFSILDREYELEKEALEEELERTEKVMQDFIRSF